MSLTSDLNAIKTIQDGVKNNKVTRFAYTQTAYANNDVDGHPDYVATRDNNIPLSDLSVIEVNQTVVDKGFRARASALNRMFLNHLFGRVSYNLNKINDLFNDLLVKIVANLGVPNGLATLDANGRIPYTQLPEDAMEYQGDWNAQTNTPTLADGTGTKGDTYNVSVGGTQDLGSGDITFFAGDRVIYNGSVWQRASGGNVLTVSEIAPNDTDGNVDLTKQTDVRKILSSSFLDKLYLTLSARHWGYTGVSGVPIACAGDNGTYYVLTTARNIYKSTDRVNWSLFATVPVGSGSGNASTPSNMVAKNGKLVVIYRVGNYWRSVVSASGGGTSKDIFSYSSSGDYIGEIYFDGENTIAFSHSSQGVYVSFDLGQTYTRVLSGNSYRLQYTNGLFHVASTSELKYSENLTDWYDTNITTNIFSGVVYANGLWVAGAQSGNKHPYWSTDGKTWTEGTGDTPRLSGSGTVLGTSRIVYLNGLWIAITYGGDANNIPCLALWSEDGKVWAHCTSPDDSLASSQSWATSAINVIYARGIYLTNVIRTSSGHSSVYYSYNGKDWLAIDNSDVGSLLWVIYADGKFVGITSTKRVWSSIDGIVWEKVYDNSSDTFSEPSNGKDRNNFLNYKNGIWLDVCQSIYSPSGEKYINGEQE